MRHLLTQRLSARCIKEAQGVSGLPTPSRLQGFRPVSCSTAQSAASSLPCSCPRRAGNGMSACISRRLRQPSAAARGRCGEGKPRRFQPVLITKHSVCDGRQRRGSSRHGRRPVFIALQPLRLPLRQLAPCRGQRIEGHRRIAAAAGLAMGTQPYEGKPAALPEAPQLSGIAEADGEIVIASGIGWRCRRSSPARGLPAGGWDGQRSD